MDELSLALLNELRENGIRATHDFIRRISGPSVDKTFYIDIDGVTLSLRLWTGLLCYEKEYDISNPKFTFDKVIFRIKRHMNG